MAEDGDVQMAAFLKVEAEAFLFVDSDYGSPQDRWRMLLQLHEEVRFQAREMGLSEVNLWAPPEVPKAFLRRLSKLGWSEDRPWKTFTYRLR